MIYYRPTDGDPHLAPLRFRPRTCFLMTQLGGSIPPILSDIRTALKEVLLERSFSLIDADSAVTGRDFLIKIWEFIVAVPLGIAIIHEEMKPGTVANIFYELGLMQAYGKETLVIKTKDAAVPSDFVRTEYVQYGPDFQPRMRRFLDSLDDRAAYYAMVAEQVERNPLLAVDFLRRAFLLTEDKIHRDRAREVFAAAGLRGRAKNSVEMLLVDF
jgi:hypothetical protein